MSKQSSVEETKFPVKSFIAFILMIAVIILLWLLLIKVRSEGYQCTRNPIYYGVTNLDWIEACDCKVSNYSKTGSCICLSNDNQFTSFRATKEGIFRLD